MTKLLKHGLARSCAAATLAFTTAMTSVAAFAQTGTTTGGSVDVSTHSTSTTTLWYGQWWVWAVGVAVFLIIIVALTNRGGRSA